jgi:radical SAM superfamily enzyme YgiQ (UPF0313 family)
MKKNTVVLFYPKTEKNNINKNLPFAILKLASELKGAGYEVIAIDERFEEDYENQLINALDKAVCFGVSVMTGYQIGGGLKASTLVRKIDGKVPIVWGGWHPSILPEETLENENIDILVRGQGERTLCELAAALKNNTDLKSIEGLSYKKDGRIISNRNREPNDVNTFYPIRFDLLDMDRYIFKSPLGERSIFWNSSQGCPYQCGFCSTPVVYHRRWSGLRAETIIEQLKELIGRYKIDSVTFAEDNFFVDMGRVEKLCDGIIKNKLKLRWAADVRVDRVIRFPESFMSLLKESGCSKLYVGAESGDQEMLDLMNKMIKVEDTYKAAELLDKVKIISEFFIIVGFPHDPKKDLKKSLELIRGIKSRYPDHQFSTYIYTPYPGTPLLESAVKNGLKIPDSLEDWVRWSIVSVNTPWVDKKYLDSVNMYSKCFYPLAFPSPALRARFTSGVIGATCLLLHKIARFRVEKDFYRFPVEWKLIKYFHAVKARYNIFKGIESFR